MRRCLTEADEPFPFPDFEAGEMSKVDRSSASSATVNVPSVSVSNSSPEEAAELQRKVEALSEDAAEKEALVGKLQRQLDQLVQQLGEKRDAISDVGA
eukprot:COSAG06_NODE_77_length_25671_cov_16.409119_15_plen_98_part_00